MHVNCDPDPNVAAVMDDPDAKFVCALCDDKKLTALILKKKMVDPGYVFKIVQCDGMKFVTPPCK